MSRRPTSRPRTRSARSLCTTYWSARPTTFDSRAPPGHRPDTARARWVIGVDTSTAPRTRSAAAGWCRARYAREMTPPRLCPTRRTFPSVAASITLASASAQNPNERRPGATPGQWPWVNTTVPWPGYVSVYSWLARGPRTILGSPRSDPSPSSSFGSKRLPSRRVIMRPAAAAAAKAPTPYTRNRRRRRIGRTFGTSERTNGLLGWESGASIPDGLSFAADARRDAQVRRGGARDPHAGEGRVAGPRARARGPGAPRPGGPPDPRSHGVVPQEQRAPDVVDPRRGQDPDLTGGSCHQGRGRGAEASGPEARVRVPARGQADHPQERLLGQGVTRRRLDAELIRRGLVASPQDAAGAVSAGRVTVAGRTVDNPASLVAPDEPIHVLGPPPAHASRGGLKLSAALARFGLDPAGRRCLDAGASTGGFTDVLLAAGAASVVAVDVGYGQLSWRLGPDRPGPAT